MAIDYSPSKNLVLVYLCIIVTMDYKVDAVDYGSREKIQDLFLNFFVNSLITLTLVLFNIYLLNLKSPSLCYLCHST